MSDSNANRVVNPFKKSSASVPLSLENLRSSNYQEFQKHLSLRPSSNQDENIDSNNKPYSILPPSLSNPKVITQEQVVSSSPPNAPPNTSIFHDVPLVNSNLVNVQIGSRFLDHSKTLVTTNSVDEIKCRIEQYQNIRKLLKPLFNIIHSSNQFINNKFISDSSRGRFSLYQEEIYRLRMGLYFYQPVATKGIEFIQKCYKNNPLYEQIKTVERQFKLDFLKSLYAVKELYIFQKKVQRQKTCLFYVNSSDLLDIQFVRKGVQDFLIFDKQKLLTFFNILMKLNKTPSACHFCSVREELDVIQRSIYCLEKELPNIQNQFFHLFLKYSKIAKSTQNPFIQSKLKKLKKYMYGLRLSPEIKQCLQEENVEEMLSNQTLKPEELEGHLRDIGQMLIYEKNIDFQAGLQRLANLNKLSLKWNSYLKNYLIKVEFQTQSEYENLLKGIYLFKIMKIIAWNSQFFDKREEITLVEKIIKLSLPLAISYLQVLNSREAKIEIIKLIAKYSQYYLRECDKKFGNILNKYIQGYETGKIVSYFINHISIVFQEFLQKDDFTIFETAISGGRALGFNFNLQNKRVYESVDFYRKLLNKYPSCFQQIHQDICRFFQQLKKLNIEVTSSFLSYNSTLKSIRVSFEIVVQYLAFSTYILDNAESISQIASSWFKIFNKYERFDPFVDFFIGFTEKVLEKQQNQYELSVLNQGISMFASSIFDYACRENGKLPFLDINQVKIIKMLYNIKQFYVLIKTNPPQVLQTLLSSIRQRMIDLIRNPLKIIFPNDSFLPTSQKLILFQILTSIPEQYNASQKRQTSKLIELLKIEKDSIPYNFMNQITKNITEDLNFDVISVLQAVTSADDVLTRNITIKNAQEVIDAVQKMKKISFLNLNKTLKIIASLHSLQTKMLENGQKAKLFYLIQALQAKVMLWFKNGKLTEILFPPLFDFFSEDINNIDYGFHVKFLEEAQEVNYFRLLNRTQINRLEIYGVTLLITCITKKKEKGEMKPQSDDQINHLKKEIKIFTAIGICIIQHNETSKEGETISKFGQDYLLELNSFLSFYQKQKKENINFLVKRSKISLNQAKYKQKKTKTIKNFRSGATYSSEN